MVAEEGMLSSVAATDKLRTLIKLTGFSLSPPLPPRYKPGPVLQVKERVLQSLGWLRSKISVAIFNSVTLNKLPPS